MRKKKETHHYASLQIRKQFNENGLCLFGKLQNEFFGVVPSQARVGD